jgi:hypothetical protein
MNTCRRAILLLVVASLLGTCAPRSTPGPATAPISPTPTIPAPTLIRPTAVPAEHRIRIRTVNGVAEFYDRETDSTFVPRGSNYIRLASLDTTSGKSFTYHSTFNVGLYDAERAETALTRMQADGYNTVRVFLTPSCPSGCLGDPTGRLSPEYVANLADFLRRAKSHGIYVIITTDSEPDTPYYLDIKDSTWSADFGGTNSEYLLLGGIMVGQQFWSDLVLALIAQEAPLDAILAYAIRNEFFFDTSAEPLNWSYGSVTTASGTTYDMALEDDKQHMMDEGVVLYIDRIRAAILQVDPTALVTIGFFPPDRPNVWNSAPRRIRTYPALWNSSADFIDLHPYPGGYDLGKLVENFEMQDFAAKPVLMGELGAARSSYASAAGASLALHDWQVDSCNYGFDGWLLWTWDSTEQADFYNGLDDGGLINQSLAPINRPDPCAALVFEFFERNLALTSTVNTSRWLGSNPATYAVDGIGGDWWSAGAFAPQWIEIDLGQRTTVRLIRLVVSQSPRGETSHEVRAGAEHGNLTLVHTFEGVTDDLQVLEWRPETPLENVRYVRVTTRKSPSWIGWREIEVIAQ